jgi:hypothetical protein
MNNLTVAIPGDAVVGTVADEMMDHLARVSQLRPDTLTVDFSAVLVADAAWLAMLHLRLLDVEEGGALILLDRIPGDLAPMLGATGMQTAFFCRFRARKPSQ